MAASHARQVDTDGALKRPEARRLEIQEESRWVQRRECDVALDTWEIPSAGEAHRAIPPTSRGDDYIGSATQLRCKPKAESSGDLGEGVLGSLSPLLRETMPHSTDETHWRQVVRLARFKSKPNLGGSLADKLIQVWRTTDPRYSVHFGRHQEGQHTIIAVQSLWKDPEHMREFFNDHQDDRPLDFDVYEDLVEEWTIEYFEVFYNLIPHK